MELAAIVENRSHVCSQEYYLPRVSGSANRSNPSFGTWKVRIALAEKDSRNEVSRKEYSFNFVEAKNASNPPPSVQAGKLGNPFPVPPFKYQRWDLKDWGVGKKIETAKPNDSLHLSMRPSDLFPFGRKRIETTPTNSRGGLQSGSKSRRV